MSFALWFTVKKAHCFFVVVVVDLLAIGFPLQLQNVLLFRQQKSLLHP